ncbi:MAG: hypothetical protein MUF15_17500 [Acidobacteria bacterium]|nr:hypothetical protein [Acidobacteriota bacterium]
MEIKTNDQLFSLTVKKVQEKKIDAEGIPGFTWVEDPQHKMLYYFNKPGDSYDFILINPNLNVTRKYTLKRGQGPKELLKPYFIGGTLDEVFIYDGTARRLMILDREFKNCNLTKKTLHSVEFIGAFGYSPKTGFLLLADEFIQNSTGNATARFYLRNIKNGGKESPFYQVKYKCAERDENGKLKVWGGRPHHARLIDNFVFIINLANYTIYKYDLNGQLIKAIKIQFIAKTFSKSQNEETKAAWGENNRYMTDTLYPDILWPACWILPIGKGLAVGRRDDYIPSKSQWITADFFDLDLNFLGKIRLPAFANWNHPLFSNWLIERSIFSSKEKLWIIREHSDIEEIFLEEWGLTYEK